MTHELRSGFVAQIRKIEEQFEDLPPSISAIPAIVKLEKNALAKSHRPISLFNQETWSIIGVGEPGELFVKVSPEKTAKLRQKIETGFSAQAERAISTINEISPVEPKDRLGGLDSQEVFESSPERRGRKLIKVKLFSFDDWDDENANIKEFERVLETEQIPFTKQENYANQLIYQVECDRVAQVEKLARTVMVRSIARLPIFKMLRFNKFNQRPIPPTLSLPLPDPESYPIVAVVDGGVSSQIQNLEKWIYKREQFVAPAEQNTYHGTFVSGLIVWGHELNTGLDEVDPTPCRILDIHVLPNVDPLHGSVGVITETEFLRDLEQCLELHANNVKVWNLSLGSDEICRLDKFSDFAIQLDNLQEQYNVTFVIAAGNYDDAALLGYPRNGHELEQGRITAPADSALGITVGSVSQVSHPTSGTRQGQPSPFSRNGPGPNHIIKPDFVHYGGNIGKDRQYLLGLTSLSDENNIGDNVGTSFSAPLVSRKLAYIYDRVTPVPSPTLARALLTHNARDLRTRDRVLDEDNYCLGFGTPIDIDLSLRCQSWYSTMVFEETLRPGYELEWDYFPYPESLHRDGKFRGEIWMTLAYPRFAIRNTARNTAKLTSKLISD